MSAYTGAATDIIIYVNGIDLTAAQVAVVFAWQPGQVPMLSKTKAANEITVTYDGTKSTLSLTLSATDTAQFTRSVQYTVWYDDGTAGGYRVPDNGGSGTIPFTNVVKRT